MIGALAEIQTKHFRIKVYMGIAMPHLLGALPMNVRTIQRIIGNACFIAY